MPESRVVVFISHANPEDNKFVVWLGAKLTQLGYEVWADVLRLRGGHDWQRQLEQILRNRTLKVLLAANQVSVQKQGVRNELQIASSVATKLKDSEFVIPLRLAEYDAPFLVAQAQYINFEESWTAGLRELLTALADYGVPRQPQVSDPWKHIQLAGANVVVSKPERLVSNWLRVKQLPRCMRLYEFRSGVPLERARERFNACRWAVVPFRDGFLSFATLKDVEAAFGLDFPAKQVAQISSLQFVADGWKVQQIDREQARRQFSDALRQSVEHFLRGKGLASYAMSNRRFAWWVTTDNAPKGKTGFEWGQLRGKRQITGVSAIRKVHWHYGISVAVRSAPLQHVRVFGHLVFTEDGATPVGDVTQMHRLRRSFAKSWRNPRWRDMCLSFLSWLADGGTELVVPTSSGEALRLEIPPIILSAPVSIPARAEHPEADDDDPALPADAEFNDEDSNEGQGET